jgi:hypothetical protein
MYLSLMKSLIRKILREQDEEIITLPPFSFFTYDWNEVLEYADGRLFRISGDFDLSLKNISSIEGLVEVDGDLELAENHDIVSLNNLKSVSGRLNLYNCSNLMSLGKLERVGSNLNLNSCKKLTSFENLKYVGGSLYLSDTKLVKLYSHNEIRRKVKIEKTIWFW